ncbi:MAG: hypothetical protein QE277_10580 [Flectobacillus sp.]|nr:hypothetical protein [Flectobacillus sp.]
MKKVLYLAILSLMSLSIFSQSYSLKSTIGERVSMEERVTELQNIHRINEDSVDALSSGSASTTVAGLSAVAGGIAYCSISDMNDKFIPWFDFLCTGRSKVYKAVAFDSQSNIITGPMAYQWKKDGVNIPGATTQTLTVSEPGRYSFVVGYSVTSNIITLVIGNYIDLSVRVHGDEVVCIGTARRIESSYYSNTASYQWEKDGVLLSGAVNRAYDATQSGLYRLTVTDQGCLSTQSEQRLSFGTSLFVPKISVSNGDTTLCGSYYYRYLFAATPNSLNPTQYSYEWKKNGVTLSGFTKDFYGTSEGGVFTVTYTQGTCSTTSREVTLVNSNLAQKPVITAGNITSICNGSIQIDQNINGTPRYLDGTWYKDGVSISSSVSSQYTAIQSGSYKVIHGSGSCANESNTVTVSIGTTFNPKIYIPTSFGKTNLCGTGDYLHIYFDYRSLIGGNYTYQWQKNGVNLPREISQSLYVNTAGTYTLIVSNGSCSGVSNSIVITNTNSPVTTLTSSDNTISCSIRAIRLDIKGGRTYYNTPLIWKKDGVIIAGETSPYSYVSQAGVYTATYNDRGCSATTEPIYINTGIRQPNAIPSVTINRGEMTTLTTDGCTGIINWYSSPTGGNSLGTGVSFSTPTLSTQMTYYADCTVNGCVSSFRTSGRVSINCTGMYSIKSGDWSDASIWSCGRIPTSTDIVTISNGDIVTIPSGQTGFVADLIQNGILVNNGLLKLWN